MYGCMMSYALQWIPNMGMYSGQKNWNSVFRGGCTHQQQYPGGQIVPDWAHSAPFPPSVHIFVCWTPSHKLPISFPSTFQGSLLVWRCLSTGQSWADSWADWYLLWHSLLQLVKKEKTWMVDWRKFRHQDTSVVSVGLHWDDLCNGRGRLC